MNYQVGTTKGTILRQRYGKFVINEELTKKSIDEKNKLEHSAKKLLAEYKTNGVDYLITEIDDDYVMLKNQKTGLEFELCDFKKKVFDSLLGFFLMEVFLFLLYLPILLVLNMFLVWLL